MSTKIKSSLRTETDLKREVTGTVDTVENTDAKIQKSNLEYEQLTEEEKRRHKKICEKVERLYATATKKTCTDKHFKSLDDFVYTLGKIANSYFYFQDFPLKICDDSKQKAGVCLAESAFVPTVCDFLVEGLKTERNSFDVSPESNSALWYKAQEAAFNVVWNFTDCSREVGRIVNDHKYLLPLLVGKLWEWQETFIGKEKNERIHFFVRATLSIFHNIAMHDVIEKLRELQASLILVKYLKYLQYLKSESIDERKKLKFLIIATLAEVMTDEEADSLIVSSDVARFLLSLLKNALLAKDHRCYSFSVTELGRAVKQLARNDTYKKMLVNEGVLEHLTTGLKAEYLPEQNICLEALWMLSFKQRNREKMMQEAELLDLVTNLYRNRFVNDHTQKLSQGILWQLRYELKKNKKFAGVTKFLEMRTNFKTASSQHVMLSYQRDDRDLVLQIRDCLKQEGYKVWIDVDSIEGSTAEAMAFAVEQAFVVILCTSQKYKDSMYCRADNRKIT